MSGIARIALWAVMLIGVTSAHGALFGKKDVDEERAKLREAQISALEKLYSEKPGTKQEIADSKGYAVFSNVGVNVLVLSTQRGGGILHDNRSGQDTYMKMMSAGAGIGLGIKDFSAIFIFHTDSALDGFQKDGWDFSAQADANIESENKGKGTETATTAMPGTTLYQLTDAGVAAQVTLQGTKFWANDDLN